MLLQFFYDLYSGSGQGFMGICYMLVKQLELYLSLLEEMSFAGVYDLYSK